MRILGLFYLLLALLHLGNIYHWDELTTINQFTPELVLVLLLFAIAGFLLYPRTNRMAAWYSSGFGFKTLFTAFALVLLVRELFLEPYSVGSNSMLPGLKSGDFVWVHKYAYGFRLPYTRQRLLMLNPPQRGDVVVFSVGDAALATTYVKRIVGLPGDVISYEQNRLVINGNRVPLQEDGEQMVEILGEQLHATRYLEYLGDDSPHYIVDHKVTMHALGSQWQVGPGHYFVLGDNRDASNDSRFIGQVPEYRLLGKVKK